MIRKFLLGSRASLILLLNISPPNYRSSSVSSSMSVGASPVPVQSVSTAPDVSAAMTGSASSICDMDGPGGLSISRAFHLPRRIS